MQRLRCFRCHAIAVSVCFSGSISSAAALRRSCCAVGRSKVLLSRILTAGSMHHRRADHAAVNLPTSTATRKHDRRHDQLPSSALRLRQHPLRQLPASPLCPGLPFSHVRRLAASALPLQRPRSPLEALSGARHAAGRPVDFITSCCNLCQVSLGPHVLPDAEAAFVLWTAGYRFAVRPRGLGRTIASLSASLCSKPAL